MMIVLAVVGVVVGACVGAAVFAHVYMAIGGVVLALATLVHDHIFPEDVSPTNAEDAALWPIVSVWLVAMLFWIVTRWFWLLVGRGCRASALAPSAFVEWVAARRRARSLPKARVHR